MSVALYMDENVHGTITDGLRQRGGESVRQSQFDPAVGRASGDLEVIAGASPWEEYAGRVEYLSL